MKISVFIPFVTVIFICSCNKSDELLYKQQDAPVDDRVEDLLERMTLEEKVAQMRMFHANIGAGLNDDDQLELSDLVREKLETGIGGIKNPGEHYSPGRAALLNNMLQQYIIENNRLGIPAFFVTESYNGVDAEGCTRFGRPINMASTFNRALVKEVFDGVGREARLRGLHLTHSPVADIVRDPRFGRMSEAFGEDSYLTSQMIISAITGLQGDYSGLKSTHIGAVVKHFAGYGQVAGGTNFASVEISPRTLADEIFPPFKAAVEDANTLGVMASHGDLNGIASHANPWLLTETLRNQWGFEGYVVSDANDVGRLHYFMQVAESPEEAVLLALKAGVDVDLYAEDAYAMLPGMVEKDPELMTYIDRAVRRVLRTKFILGLFENPYTDVEMAVNEIHSDKNLDLARTADRESIILLKNEDLLPLDPEKKMTIALVGPLLDQLTGSHFRNIAGSKVRFFEEKGFDLTNGARAIPVMNSEDVQRQGIQKIVEIARKADLVVLFAGGDEYTAKESFFNGALGDRDNIDPAGLQDELMDRIKKLGLPVVVVLKHRRTLSINAFSEHADAILDCWDLSEEGDYAVAEILFGRVNPSGRLPVTVPRSIGQIPFHYSQKEINFKKGYLFTENSPLYSFGSGLSYTRFEYSGMELSDTILSPGLEITASIVVSNKGEKRGKETIQLYIKDLYGSVLRPMQELKGFEKIDLEPGQSRKVSFIITPGMLEFTDLNMEKRAEAGSFELRIGSSCEDYESRSFQFER